MHMPQLTSYPLQRLLVGSLPSAQHRVGFCEESTKKVDCLLNLARQPTPGPIVGLCTELARP